MPKAIYTRISDDDGSALGVRRQLEDCRKLAAVHRWDVPDRFEFEDNDASAFRGTHRPGFEAMLAALSAGEVDGIIVYDLDRLTRYPKDLERVIEIYDAIPGLTFATIQGGIDLSSADGLTLARVMIAFANKSSRDTGRRVARKHVELAQNGHVPTGPRPFGWKPNRIELEPAEAAEVRRAAADVLAGKGVGTVAAEWQARGVVTQTGNSFTPSGLRSVLTNPRIAGVRRFKGEIVRDAAGQPVRGQWEPIIDWPTFELLAARLAPKKHTQAGRRKYELSGLVRCGECGARMGGGRTGFGHVYRCQPAPLGCGRVTVTGHNADRLVAAAVLKRLAGIQSSGPQDWPKEEELADCQRRRHELMQKYADGVLDAEAAFPAAERLTARIAELQRERGAHIQEQAEAPLADVVASWDSLDPGQRRLTISSVVEAVVLRRRGQGNAGKFDPSRVTIVWRSPTPA